MIVLNENNTKTQIINFLKLFFLLYVKNVPILRPLDIRRNLKINRPSAGYPAGGISVSPPGVKRGVRPCC